MFTPSWYPGPRQLRQFAGFNLLACAFLGFLAWRSSSQVLGSVLWGFGGFVAAASIPFPGVIRPYYALLMGVTLPIGWLISNLFLRIIFYGVFTPLGLLFQLLGRDPLLLKKPRGDTFWRPYPRPKDVASYYRQS